MTDVFDKETRRRVMSRIRSKNTRPELMVRSYLHRSGVRYRVNVRDLPGRPDIAIKSRRIAIFVNGCFWHVHADCPFAAKVKSNVDFWSRKLTRNIERDLAAREALREMGFRIATVWECSLRTKGMAGRALPRLLQWIGGNRKILEL